MPTVNRSRNIAKIAWGCSCRSYRPGTPDPETAYRRIVANKGILDVKVKFLKEEEGMTYFRCHTGEDSYTVVLTENDETGWCKHIAACAKYLVGEWLGTAWAGVKIHHYQDHEEKKRLRAENRKLENRVKKLEAKNNIENGKT